MLNKAVFINKAVDLKKLKSETEKYQSETTKFEITKAIELNNNDFKEFCNRFLEDRDFIIENLINMGYEDNKYSCLLVYNKNSEDAILVESEGYSYARYTALVKKSEVAEWIK